MKKINEFRQNSKKMTDEEIDAEIKLLEQKISSLGEEGARYLQQLKLELGIRDETKTRLTRQR